MKISTKLIIPILISILLFIDKSFAQVKKYVLLEQFTQASCGPCAAENPSFNSNILGGPHKSKIHHIAYHVFWPGVDPMYNADPNNCKARVNYYGVQGVPDLYLQGLTWAGSAGSISNTLISNAALNSSPVAVAVKETSSGTTRNVTVKIFIYGSVNPGNYVLRTAVVENPVNYSSPPGSNGEKFFPGVFRKMLPSASGSVLNLPAIGDSLVFNYSYNLSSGWIPANVYSIAFIEEDNSKIVLNSGSSLDPPISFALPKAKFTTTNSNACVGKAVQFSDASLNFPQSWEWSFPGGNPSTSNLQNPQVVYNTPGTYDVKLKVNGLGNGIDSTHLIGYIQVGKPGAPAPFLQGFEPVSFPPQGWSVNNPDQLKSWARTQSAKKSGNASAYINNYNYNVVGAIDELISPSWDLSSLTNPSLHFQLAYIYYSDPNFTDTLEVFISDCGSNYISIYKKWGNALATAPSGMDPFVPDASAWRQEIIDLSAYKGSENAKLKFRQISGAQNNLYIDDIELLDANGIDEFNHNDAPVLFPIPSKGYIYISMKSLRPEAFRVYDLAGKLVYSSTGNAKQDNSFVYDLHTLDNGIYTAEIISGNSHKFQKLVLIK